MNLSTTYLGLQLKHPLMPGASPLVDNMDTVRRLEDAGASAIVMHSLFEEQIQGEQLATIYHMEIYSEAYSEAVSYFPKRHDFRFGPQQYVDQVGRIKRAVEVPVIASLNGTTRSGWLDYAKQIQQAGADAIELNVYYLPTDTWETGQQVEDRVIDMCTAVKEAVTLPVAVKLSPFFSALPNLVHRLQEAGAGGFVLFNRFYQPDIDPYTLDVQPALRTSDSSELLLRLRWLAILSAHLETSWAVSGGVHSVEDAIKAIMAGAHAVQMVSALLRRGPDHLTVVLDGLSSWMEEQGYESVRQMRGSMNHSRCPDPRAFERGNYMRILQSWDGGEDGVPARST
jgi:dihydroorotate dehydrogenase (fumarate)